MVFCAQSSQFQMWMSVPQMPVFATFTSTSSGPISGTGSILHPEAGLGLGFDEGFHVIAHQMIPAPRPASVNASIAKSTSASLSAADICVRMRALPFGTTGIEEAGDIDAALVERRRHLLRAASPRAASPG